MHSGEAVDAESYNRTSRIGLPRNIVAAMRHWPRLVVFLTLVLLVGGPGFTVLLGLDVQPAAAADIIYVYDALGLFLDSECSA